MAKTNLPINPFPGIRSYDTDESDLFFGRDKQIKELTSSILEHRFLSVIGASGGGKSSLINAGLIPAIISQNKGKCNIIKFRPGEDPVGRLAERLLNLDEQESSPEKVSELRSYLLEDNFNLVNYIKERKLDNNTLIVVDQFEELFRYKRLDNSENNMEEAVKFVNMLITAFQQADTDIYVAITMRTDFMDNCNEFPGLTEVVNRANYLVPRMTVEELRQAIVEPIKYYNGSISGELVEVLLHDIGDDPDQLPILQHAMMRTWDYWKLHRIGDQEITIEHYRAIGTMKEALSMHLEEIFTELWGDSDRRIAEKVFKALTGFNVEKKITRRPTRLEELSKLAGAEMSKVIRIIDIFREPGRTFLMPPPDVELEQDTIIDISHESIMRIWVRLRDWIEEERQSSELYQRLATAALLFDDGKTGLWTDPELQVAVNWKNKNVPNKTWADRYNPDFRSAMDFLELSRKTHEDALRKKEAQQKKNLRRARRFSIILGLAAIISIIFLVISLQMRNRAESSRKNAIEKEQLALIASKRAEEQRKEALIQKRISDQQQQIAEQQKILAEEQRRYAVQQQVIAVEQSRIATMEKKKADSAKAEAIIARDEAKEQRREAITQKEIAEQEKNRAEISEANAQRLMLLSIARTTAIQAARIYETVEGELPKLLALQAYKFNRDNGGSKYNPDIFDALAITSEDLVIFRQHHDGVRAAEISPDGKILATCSDDGNVYVWNINDNSNPLRQISKDKKQSYRNILISPNGKYLISGTADGDVFIWDAPFIKSEVRIIEDGHHDIINHIAINASSEKLLTASSDGTVKLWDIRNPKIMPLLIDSVNSKVLDVEISPQQIIMYCCQNGEIKYYGFGTQKEPLVLAKADQPVPTIGISPDGIYLAAGLLNGSILIYNMENINREPIEIIGRHTSGITSLKFTVDLRLISASYDGQVKIGHFLEEDDNPITIDEHDLWIYDVSASVDGDNLVTASADRTARYFVINPELLVEKLLATTSRELTREEWDEYIGPDIKYGNTRENLP